MSTRPAFRRSSTGGERTGAGEPARGQQTSTPGVAAPFSHAQILQLMKAEFGRARRLGHALACIVVRIDGMARFGEHFGAAIRDRVHDGLARLVREKTRDYDHLGLTGEDGCLIVLPQTESAGATVVAERIRRTFMTLEFGLSAEDRAQAAVPRLTLSFGISATGDSETLFFDTLLAQAEHARDVAAAAGGDRVEVFSRDRFVSDPHGRS